MADVGEMLEKSGFPFKPIIVEFQLERVFSLYAAC
jgi:hypothetical protein